MIEQKNLVEINQTKMIAAEINSVVSEMRRKGWFLPTQWILGRNPRYSAVEQGEEPAGQLGSPEQRVDPTTIFAERVAIRHRVKIAFIYMGSSERVAKALFRKAAPKTGDNQVGDLISFQLKQGSGGVRRKRWSTAARIICSSVVEKLAGLSAKVFLSA